MDRLIIIVLQILLSPGANSLDSKTASDNYTNLTGGSEDFHVKDTNADIYDAGTDLSGSLTDDIDGDSRSQWDIGADEYTTGATTHEMAGTSDAVATFAGALFLSSVLAGQIAGIASTTGAFNILRTFGGTSDACQFYICKY